MRRKDRDRLSKILHIIPYITVYYTILHELARYCVELDGASLMLMLMLIFLTKRYNIGWDQTRAGGSCGKIKLTF